MKRDDQVQNVLRVFGEYLEARGIREATRKSYLNSTAKMIGEYVKNEGNLEEIAVSAYAADLARGSLNVFRVGWKHFRAMCMEEESPVPPEAKHASLAQMRQDVADAVRYISSQMSVKQIHKQRWDGIATIDNRVSVINPDQSVIVFVGSHAVHAFQTLAIAYHDTPRPGRSYPLLPVRAGDMMALSPASTRLLIRQGRPIKIDDDIEVPPELLAYVSALLGRGIEPARIMRALGTIYTAGMVDPLPEPKPRASPQAQLELEAAIEEEEHERPKTKEQIDSEALDKLTSERPRAVAIPTFAAWQKNKSS